MHGAAMSNIRRTGIPATIDGKPNPEYSAAVVLTLRQRQVCELIVQGKTNKEIARDLSISPRTVEDHRTDIYAAMDVRNAVGLIYKVLTKKEEA
jgi:DNA-binding NarL/FixJ family response regulator